MQTPLEVAQQCAQQALALAGNGDSVVLAMGENHHIFSHQVSQVLALKELVAKKQNVTLFIENPHNRLYTILLDRGYDRDDASKLAQHISERDHNGHITAKALIGGNPDSLRGKENFLRFGAQMMLQAAVHHGARIVYADAARVYPEDFCMDYSDPSTNGIASKLNARKGPEGECGPDDMLIRNTHMAETMKRELGKTGGIGLAHIGAAHGLGVNDEANGLHYYRDSLAEQFQNTGLPAVVVSMQPDHALPPDYKIPAGAQRHIFSAPSPATLTNNMSEAEIGGFLTKNGLTPSFYDPKKFAKNYRAEFNEVLKQAETVLGISIPAPPSGGGRPDPQGPVKAYG